MSKISIVDLEVHYCVGVPDEERAQPQRLLFTIELTADFTSAILTDRVSKTINYYDVCQRLLKFGENRSWKLIERLADNIASDLLTQFKPESVTVEVKKFVIPQARYVSVTVTRSLR
jgi:FolB domain-containing protein